MGGHAHASRKRGVRASRLKLYQALTDAGLKTQVALAARIADLEGLDEVPRDLVNRVFREQPVEMASLERVARGLGVQAYTLYKTADDQDREFANAFATDVVHPPDPMPEGMIVAGDTRRFVPPRPLFAVVVLAVIVLALLVWTRLPEPVGSDPTSRSVATDATSERVSLDLGQTTLVVLPLRGDDDARLTIAMREALSRHFSVASTTATMLQPAMGPDAAKRKLRTDVSIDGQMVAVGRFVGLRMYLYTGGRRQQVWAESLPAAMLERSAAAIAERSSLAIRYALGVPIPGAESPPHYPLAPVQDDYLQGMMYLDQPANELNIKRAQSRFAAALRQDANFARAHAGLCRSLVEEYWMDDAQHALTDAAKTCGQALQLSPDDPVVQVSHAHFLRLTGRSDAAVALYQKVLKANPSDADALAGLAETWMHEFRQSGDRHVLETAMDAAQKAGQADPSIWKPLFSLATMHYLAGDVAAAIRTSEEALARDVNEYVLGNLGTFYFCNGELGRARETYLRAQQVAPQSYVGDEFLGQVHYFLGEFERSRELRLRAIESVASGSPEIHEMWGNLADSNRQAGRRDDAVKAYLKAAEIAERDGLVGTATVADRIARAYYYTMLKVLDPDRVSEAFARQVLKELDQLSALPTEPTASVRLAIAWLHHGRKERARAALDRATRTCPVYARMPDVMQFAVASAVR